MDHYLSMLQGIVLVIAALYMWWSIRKINKEYENSFLFAPDSTPKRKKWKHYRFWHRRS